MRSLYRLVIVLGLILLASSSEAQQQWQHLTAPTNEDFLHVAVLDRNTVVIASMIDFPRMYRSFDRGENWEEIALPGFVDRIGDIDARDGKLYVHLSTIPVGIPNLWVSNDVGNTWRKTTFEWASVHALHLLDSHIVYVAHERPNSSKLWRSTDDGASWAFSDVPRGRIPSIYFADSLTGMMVVDNAPGPSNAYVTRDSGKTWHYVASDAYSVMCLQDSIWFAAEGLINRSFDTGRTWVEGSKYYYFVSAMKPFGETGAFAIGRDGILYSSDAGENWSYVDSIESMYDIDVADGAVYATGYGGQITRLVSISEVRGKSGTDDQLRLNYRSIGWELIGELGDGVQVYDFLGRLVKSYDRGTRLLPREDFRPGLYHVVTGGAITPLLAHP